ncbi:hypothetical protein [Hyphomicrobium sp. ghe19]|uniref:hypothetical protein n=1 Tax=Hyphomicrobium sp. ghe19 TaxID=2682968 RepID=UPI0013678F70|nr:hypothetical protein HYPP_01876 [Hyphomicrobium sp. ghe19]
MLEHDLYEPVYNYLELVFRGRLKPLYGDLRHITAITANTGGNATGIWSKPDLAMIALSRQKYGLAWRIDLHGFEVKPAGTCSVQSVHEALNHSSLVHFTHLVWHCERWDARDERCASIIERCSHFGVGLITFKRPSDPQTYFVQLPARRHNPEPDAFDEFVETRISPEDREKLTAWIAELR